MGAGRKLLGTAAVLLGLAAGADFAVLSYAEGALADRAQAELGLRERPEVELHYPLLPQVFRGRYRDVRLTSARVQRAEGEGIAEITLEDVEVRIASVELAPGELTNPRQASLQGLEVRARLSLEEVNRRLPRGSRLEARPEGVTLVHESAAAGQPVTLEALPELQVEGEALILRGSRVEAQGLAAGAPVPPLPSLELRLVDDPRLRLRGATLDPAGIRATFESSSAQLPLETR